MKSVINKVIIKYSSFIYKKELVGVTKDHKISPKPYYLSQFVSILPQSTSIDKPLINKEDIDIYGAKDSDEFSFWTWRNCGITCVKMILDTHSQGLHSSIMDLTREAISLGGYVAYEDGKLVDRGWYHHALVTLLNNYDVFTEVKKWQSLEEVALDILDNKLVILSVMLPTRSTIMEDGSFTPKENAKYGGHLILATGVKLKNGEIEGVYAHDPRGLENYQADTWISKEVLQKIFSNRTIVSDRAVISAKEVIYD